MRRAIVALLLLLPLAARADGAYRAPVPASPIASLPPGAWFREGYLAYALEDEPPAPRFAAIAGSFPGDRAAERAARELDRTRLGLGYPWVVAAHELRVAGRCREAIVVVAGLFATHEEAIGWRAQDPARARLTIVALEHDESETTCAWSPDGYGLLADAAGRHLEITHVDPSGDAPGYDPDALEALGTEVRARLGSIAPVCTVRRGSVHSFAGHDHAWRLGWGFAPARCGGRVVYVPTERTLRATAFERTSEGETRVHQITDVSCDSANVDVWVYSLDGRTTIPEEPPTFTSGCAG